MENVLITGSSGFIGHKTALYFLGKGYNVIGLSRKPQKEIFTSSVVDFSNINDICNTLEKICPTIIVHCAGSADVGFSIREPVKDFDNNVGVTHRVFFALHRVGLNVKRFTFISSAGVYGNPFSLPISESAKPNPLSPYALHKEMCEDICEFFAENHGIDVKIARVFSAYGAGLKKQIFWDMYQKYKETGKIVLFGTGEESRDYIHVDDVVRALYLISTSETEETVFNVANGEEITISEAAKAFAKQLGARQEIVSFCGNTREGDPLNWKADITKLTQLGYKKTVDLDQGLADYISWASSQF